MEASMHSALDTANIMAYHAEEINSVPSGVVVY